MTKSQELMQAYNQLRGRLASDPQREVMQQRLAGTAPTITAQELYSQPLFEQLPKEEQLKVITPSLSANIQKGMILDNSKANVSTPPQILELFKSLYSNRSGSPFVVGDIASQTKNKMLGQAEDATQDQAEIDADKARLIKRVQSGDLTGAEAQGKLDTINERQGRLDRAVDVGQPLIDKRQQSTVDFLESVGADPIVKEADLTEKRKEDAEINKQSGVTGGDTADNTNWFDRLNEKVDLMAMGAAMLAGSSSGKGTAANIGQALQTGIASRNKEQLQADAKKRADAMLAIQLLSAKNKGDMYSNYGSKVQGLSSELQGAGVEGEKSELDALARLIYGVDPRIINAPEAARNKVFKYMSKKLGDDWFGDGGEISIDEAREGYKDAIKQLNAGNL